MNTNPSLEHGTVGIAAGRSGRRSPSLLRGILLPKTTRAGHEDTASDLIHSSELRKSDFRQKYDDKVIGLKNYGLNKSILAKRFEVDANDARKSAHTTNTPPPISVEELEDKARLQEMTNPWYLILLGILAAFKVMGYYLISIETILTIVLTVGLTLYWYYVYRDSTDWNGGGMDFIIITFTVISPISAALGMAFTRRERAMVTLANFRSSSYHLYLAHCLWDWPPDGRQAAQIDWLEHCDAVLAQLIGMGDELSRFLTLPSASRSRHRMTRQGRREAARTMEAAYHLLESMTTQRMTRLTLYSERIKKLGLNSGEMSRMRQYERFLSDSMEQLRMIKLYRTPQALRSFARIFTLILPPFYAPTFAQIAIDLHSLGMGVAFAAITTLCLTALFESLQVLEDPFTAYLTLDGIDVAEELQVLHFVQLISTRRLIFSDAKPYPPSRRAALVVGHALIGQPPVQAHHERYPSHVSIPNLATIDCAQFPATEESDKKCSGEASVGEASVGEAEQLQATDVHNKLELGTVLAESSIRETKYTSAPSSNTSDTETTTRRRRLLSFSGRQSKRWGLSSHGSK